MATQKQPKSSKKPDAAEAHEPPQQEQKKETPPKKRGKLVLILSVVIVLAAGGGLGFYFMQSAHSDSGPIAPKPPIFVPLETFTVNLLSDPAQMQFMQAGITLKLTEKSWAELVKDRLPEVRNRVLMVLSAKRGSELLSATGKQKLAAELSDAIRTVIAPPAAAPARAASDDVAAKDGGTKPSEQSAKGSEPGASPAADPSREDTAPKPTLEVLFTSFIIQ